MAKQEGVPAPVIDAVRAWAAEIDLERAAAVLAERRRALEPALRPALLIEVAAVQAELLIELLEIPPRAPPARDERLVEVAGFPMRQDQARRFKAWIDDQVPTAGALGLELEKWSQRLEAGLMATIAALRGAPSRASGAALDAAERIAASKMIGAADESSFAGGADPRTSDRAGLRGLLHARQFEKKR
jgi:hypothetical protein